MYICQPCSCSCELLGQFGRAMLCAGTYISILLYLTMFLHAFVHLFLFLYFIKQVQALKNLHTLNTLEFFNIVLTEDSFYLLWDIISCEASAFGLASRGPDLKICSICTYTKFLPSKYRSFRCGLSDQVKNVSAKFLSLYLLGKIFLLCLNLFSINNFFTTLRLWPANCAVV